VSELNTARGSIDTTDLGVTLMHEHVFIMTTEIAENYPDAWGDEEKRVADAIARLNELKARGVFNIVDDEPAAVREWLPYLAECAGARRPMRVPVWLARLLAGDMAVSLMTESRGFSNAKARRELGWELRYPSWRQGFREELA